MKESLDVGAAVVVGAKNQMSSKRAAIVAILNSTTVFYLYAIEIQFLQVKD